MKKLTLNEIAAMGYDINENERIMIAGGTRPKLFQWFKNTVWPAIRDGIIWESATGAAEVIIEGDRIPGTPVLNCGGWGCTVIYP